MRGTPPNAIYAFKHALVQDTAYSTMLRARRQQLHGAIAQVLEKRFPDTPPEVLAQQFEGAGQSEKAIHYWRQAGDRDLRRFAHEGIDRALFQRAASRRRRCRKGRSASNWSSPSASGSAWRSRSASARRRRKRPLHYRARAGAQPRHSPSKGRERFLATWGVWFNGRCRAAPRRRSSAPTSCWRSRASSTIPICCSRPITRACRGCCARARFRRR